MKLFERNKKKDYVHCQI